MMCETGGVIGLRIQLDIFGYFTMARIVKKKERFYLVMGPTLDCFQ